MSLEIHVSNQIETYKHDFVENKTVWDRMIGLAAGCRPIKER